MQQQGWHCIKEKKTRQRQNKERRKKVDYKLVAAVIKKILE
jgi:hypothetical protein